MGNRIKYTVLINLNRFLSLKKQMGRTYCKCEYCGECIDDECGSYVDCIFLCDVCIKQLDIQKTKDACTDDCKYNYDLNDPLNPHMCYQLTDDIKEKLVKRSQGRMRTQF